VRASGSPVDKPPARAGGSPVDKPPARAGGSPVDKPPARAGGSPVDTAIDRGRRRITGCSPGGSGGVPGSDRGASGWGTVDVR
jgi:hypothetical protein